MKKMRVGVIGVGFLGRFHAEKYARLKDVELVGVVDIDRRRAESVAIDLGTCAYTHHAQLLGKVDAVSVVVPTNSHFEVSKDFLRNDVDVLIEKPITQTLSEADELIAIAEKRQRIIQVGHLERFNPAMIAIKDIVKNPMFIESHRLSLYKPRSTDVSVVLDLMIHDIDLIMNFVKSEIQLLRAAGVSVISGQVDIANARIEFQNGCVANVTASRISTKNERKIRLFQADAYISADFANQRVTIVRRNGKNINGPIPALDINELRPAQGDSLEEELKFFIHSVVTRETPEVSGEVGRVALEIALDIMDQIDSLNRRFLGI